MFQPSNSKMSITIMFTEFHIKKIIFYSMYRDNEITGILQFISITRPVNQSYSGDRSISETEEACLKQITANEEVIDQRQVSE